MHYDLITAIGLSILVATGMALLARGLRQPLILGYVGAGMVLGPGVGLGLIQDRDTIGTIGEIGLILLLFMVGLEIDLKRLMRLGSAVVITAVGQVALCGLLGLGFFLLLGFSLGGGALDPIYLAAAISLSSTMIVVKLLYDRRDLDTLTGRITLGILVIQDVWAIFFMALQPDLENPQLGNMAFSLAKGSVLVAASFLISYRVLPHLFRWVARLPELVLLTAVAWCFAVAGLADLAGLSREMGALVAGVAVSTFPYNHDILHRIVSLRDFFITLFFVSLGLQIPSPTLTVLWMATATAGFVVASRLVTVFPLLFVQGQGVRASLLTSINLAQVSEFSLVLVALGLAAGHLSADTAAIVTLTMVLTATLSTYLIQYSDQIWGRAVPILAWVRLRDKLPAEPAGGAGAGGHGQPEVVLLGFYREADSFLQRLEARDPALLAKVLVIDFNPQVYRRLSRRGVRCLYGDISRMDLLEDSGVGRAGLILSTVPDTLLVGTSNLSLTRQLRQLAPQAQLVMTAESTDAALRMYQAGASYVLMPALASAEELLTVLDHHRDGGIADLRLQQLLVLREQSRGVL